MTRLMPSAAASSGCSRHPHVTDEETGSARFRRGPPSGGLCPDPQRPPLPPPRGRARPGGWGSPRLPLLFLCHVRLVPASEPLHVQDPLPGVLSPQSRGCIQLSPPQRGHPWKTENNDIPASLTVILSAHLSAAPPCDARSLSRGASPRSSILWARLVPAPSFPLSPRSFCGAPRRGSWGSDVLGWTVRGSCSL